MTTIPPNDFYERIKLRLRRRIGREVRLAHRVFDLGCGSCDLVRYLTAAYGQEVTGVDISGGNFPSHRRTADGSHYHCLKRDAAHLGFAKDASADAVVSLFALHEMAKPEEILREARRVLRPGGEIFIIDFPRDSVAQQLWNEEYYRPDEVEALLRDAGFEQVQARLIERGNAMWARGWKAARADRSNSGRAERR